jgi:hypothetical protein
MGGWVGLRAALDSVAKKKKDSPAGNRTPVIKPIVIFIKKLN